MFRRKFRLPLFVSVLWILLPHLSISALAVPLNIRLAQVSNVPGNAGGVMSPVDDVRQSVLLGVDVLIRQNFAPLRGRKVGLITNQTGVTQDGRSTIDVLAAAPGVKLVALFGPEHGLRGVVTAGQSVASGRDAQTGVPIHSLYGATRKPTPAMLRGVDTLVFDMQDIGSRSYTYISTMGKCMEAAAQKGIPFVVLDRPNPIGDDRIEGNITRPQFQSFVSPYPIPYRHGLTIGELARMVNGRGWLSGGARCNLTVVAMQGYRRSMHWNDTGLNWVQTSPNIPRAESPFFYAATGIAGELSTLSIGVGTPFPFQVVGAPGINAAALATEMKRRALPGFSFTAATWRPAKGVYQNRLCAGVRIGLTDSHRAQLTRLNFELMDALRKITPAKPLFNVPASETRMFDLGCGTDQVRRLFVAGKSAGQIWAAWNTASVAFGTQRQTYLLYS